MSDSRGAASATDRERREAQLRRLREERDRLIAAEERRRRQEEQEQRIRMEMERIRKKAEEKRRAEEEKRRIQAEEEKRRVEEITKQRREVEARQWKERLELKREAERRRTPSPPPRGNDDEIENRGEDDRSREEAQQPRKNVETDRDNPNSVPVSTVSPVSTVPMGSPPRTGLLSSFAGFFSSRQPAKETPAKETPSKETPGNEEIPAKEDEEEVPAKKEIPAKPQGVSSSAVSQQSRASDPRGLGSPQSPAGNRRNSSESRKESRDSLYNMFPAVNASFDPFATDSDEDSDGFPAIPMLQNSKESLVNPFGRESVVLKRLDAQSEASQDRIAGITAEKTVKLNPFDESSDVSPRNPFDQEAKPNPPVVKLNPPVVKLNPFDNETPESSPRNPFDKDVKPNPPVANPTNRIVKLNPFDNETPDTSPRNPFDEDVKPAEKGAKLNPFDDDNDETSESSPQNPFDSDVKPTNRILKLNPFDNATTDSFDIDVPVISPISLRESFSQLTSAAETRPQPPATGSSDPKTQTNSAEAKPNEKESENESSEEDEFADNPEYANERRDLRSMFEVYQSNKNGRWHAKLDYL